MSLPIHFIHFADTINNVISGMGDDQSGIVNDGTAGVVGSYLAPNPAQPFRLGSNVYFPALSRSCNFGAGAKGTHTWSYYNETFNDINALGDIAAAHYITGYGDSDTRLSFATANDIYMQAGGYGILELYAVTGTPALKVNPSAIDIDTIISANGIANALVVQGSDGFIGAGIATPSQNLHVKGSGGTGLQVEDAGTADAKLRLANTFGTCVLAQNSDGVTLSESGANPLRFSTNSVIRATVDATGILVNGGLHVGGTSDPGDNNVLVDGTAGIGTSTITAPGYAGASDYTAQLKVLAASENKIHFQSHAGIVFSGGTSDGGTLLDIVNNGETYINNATLGMLRFLSQDHTVSDQITQWGNIESKILDQTNHYGAMYFRHKRDTSSTPTTFMYSYKGATWEGVVINYALKIGAMKTGASQVACGAVANELWADSTTHAVYIGV